MTPQLAQLIESLTKKPTRGGGFDPMALNEPGLDPSVGADLGAGAMEGELRDRLFQAERTQGPGPNNTSPFEVKALSNMLGGIGKQRNMSPLAAQAEEVAGQRASNLGAMNEGFTGEQAIEQQPSGTFTAATNASPIQQRNIYKREQDRTKLEQPVKLAQMGIDDAQFRQGRQLNAQNRQTTAQMAPALMQQELNRDIFEAQKAGGGNFMDNIKQLGKNGITFQSQPGAPQVNPNQLNSALQKELGFEKGGSDPWEGFGMPDSPNPARDQAVRTIVTSSGMHPDSQAEVFDIMSDPEDRSLTFEQLAQKHGYDLNDADIPTMRQLLLQFRGF